jgi:hypothetical protein
LPGEQKKKQKTRNFSLKKLDPKFTRGFSKTAKNTP